MCIHEVHSHGWPAVSGILYCTLANAFNCALSGIIRILVWIPPPDPFWDSRTMHMLSPCCYFSTRANSGRSNVAWVRRYSQCSGERERSPIRLTERETSRWEMIDSMKRCTICQTMKIHNNATEIYHRKQRCICWVLNGAEIPKLTKQNTAPRTEGWNYVSLLWKSLFSYQFSSEITFQECQGMLKRSAAFPWKATFHVTWILVWSQVPYLNCDTSKAPLFYRSKTADLLGASLMFPLKLAAQMMNSKERVFTSTCRHWHGGSIIRLSLDHKKKASNEIKIDPIYFLAYITKP